MNFMHYIILNVPLGWMIPLVIGGTMIAAVVIAVVCHVFLKRARFSESTNEELRQLFSVGAMLFSIILGFLVVVIWQKYESVEQNVVKEASAVQSLYSQSGMLQDQDKEFFRSHLKAYTAAVIDDEWPTFSEKGESALAKQQIDELWIAAGDLKNGGDGEITISTSVSETLRTVTEARQSRLYENHIGLPWFFWTFILTYSVFIVIMFNLFKNRELRQRTAINLVLGACMGIAFLFIMLIDYPFAGDTKITPAAFEQVQQAMR